MPSHTLSSNQVQSNEREQNKKKREGLSVFVRERGRQRLPTSLRYKGVGHSDWKKGWALSSDIIEILVLLQTSPLGPIMLRDFVDTQVLLTEVQQ